MAVNLPALQQPFVDPGTGLVSRIWYLALLSLNNQVPANVVTSVNISGNNGITVAGGPITSAGVFSLGIGNLTCTAAIIAGTLTAANVVAVGSVRAANEIVTGTITAADIATTGTMRPASTGGIVGTATNDSANAGSFGEYVSAQITNASALGLTSGTALTVTGISLTAGDWDVSGNAYFNPVAITTVTNITVAISTVNNTLPGKDGAQVQETASLATGGAQGMATPLLRASLNATTAYYLVAQAAFGVSSATVNGMIRARRVR